MEKMSSDILVSVCCTTYNHEKYIETTIRSFLNQEVNFKFEIIIGEDCSSDTTRAKVVYFCETYPELVTMVSAEKNAGLIENYCRVIDKAKGKYIAFCDGDDYWSDPKKLQRQVDFLEANEDYTICCHYSAKIDENNNILYVHPKPIPLIYTFSDILLGNKDETRISSAVFRNTPELRSITTDSWFRKFRIQDNALRLHATSSSNKKIYVLPNVMSMYRIHTGGIWSMADPQFNRERARNDFGVTIEHFKYSKREGHLLLKNYIRNYLLFDLKKARFAQLLKVIKLLA